MKKKILLTFILTCIAILAAGAIGVSAKTYGSLIYEVYSDHVEITDCDTDVKEIEIPSEIDGCPLLLSAIAHFPAARALQA